MNLINQIQVIARGAYLRACYVIIRRYCRSGIITHESVCVPAAAVFIGKPHRMLCVPGFYLLPDYLRPVAVGHN